MGIKKQKKLLKPKKTKKISAVKKTRKSKKSKIVDDDEGLSIDLDDTLLVSTSISLDGSSDETEEVETVNDVKDPLESMDGDETFNLSTREDDESGILQTIRANPTPKEGWSEKKKPKFSPGDLIVPTELSKKEALEYEPYKIVCPSKDLETYSAKKSGLLKEVIIDGEDYKLAPKNGKPFKTYWELNDPFKINGLNITCPSNKK